jgi:hypothetical protein
MLWSMYSSLNGSGEWSGDVGGAFAWSGYWDASNAFLEHSNSRPILAGRSGSHIIWLCTIVAANGSELSCRQ